jgi:hypothetical protein
MTSTIESQTVTRRGRPRGIAQRRQNEAVASNDTQFEERKLIGGFMLDIMHV